jgi:transposase InsO family protein
MNTHKNAPLTPEGRARLVDLVLQEGASIAQAARSFRISRKTAGKWVARFRAEGAAGLLDRSSQPYSSPARTASELRRKMVELREQHRLSTPEIAEALGVSTSTAWRWLRRAGLGRLRSAKRDDPVRRYERQKPGELLHVDVKKLARFNAVGHFITKDRTKGRSRGVGYDFVHVAIDDHTRLAYVEVHGDEKAITAIGFLKRALRWYAEQGIQVERLMSDNGSCYRAKDFNRVLKSRGIRHIYTRPYTPQTNGKAERFIKTMAREWAYSRAYPNSETRNQVLPCWLGYYNEDRPHGSLGRKPPVSRVPEYNVVRNHS